MAKMLGCSVYHCRVGSSEQKKGILRRLIGQTEPVFSATKALGLRVDAPRILRVIHMGFRAQLKQAITQSHIPFLKSWNIL